MGVDKIFKTESVDTNLSDVHEDISISIDWVREKRILERKRKMTILMIVMVFLVTAAMMAMSVVHVEKNSPPYECAKSGLCMKLLCKLQASTGSASSSNCYELAGGLNQSVNQQHNNHSLGSPP